MGYCLDLSKNLPHVLHPAVFPFPLVYPLIRINGDLIFKVPKDGSIV